MVDHLATEIEHWLDRFNRAARAADFSGLESLLHADSHWRDLLAFTWHLTTVSGARAIARRLEATFAAAGPGDLELDPDRAPPRLVSRAGTEAIEAIFRFETRIGRGSGVLRLTRGDGDPGRWRAWTLLTALDELEGFEEKVGARRPRGEAYSREFGGPNWLDQRAAARAYADRDPAVLVVGGGQAGLAVAARLGQLDVDTLVVDRERRVGDNWRRRYHSLTLHNEVHVNHLPYMPFPETWPAFIPKDKLANWLEAYVEAMEINFWTGTEFLGGDYDEAAERWTVRLRGADGSERVMRPRHVVLATGVSGIPRRPALPGLDAFAGEVLHSGEFTDGSSWRGRPALVLGSGNSGHDVAQDLHAHGARTTIVQRSPTTVVSVEPSGQMVYALYREGPSTADCDLITSSVPYPLLTRSFQLLTEAMQQTDRELLADLERAGFRLDWGEDGTGFQMKYLRRGGGYYLDVGCSGLVARGEIGLVQLDDVETFVAEGARLRDGRVVPADLVVLATGYHGQEALLRRLFGEAVAARVGPVWGFDDEGELRAMWKRTGQPGLWFTAGSFAQCRIYSRPLALQIKACEEGIIPLARERRDASPAVSGAAAG